MDKKDPNIDPVQHSDDGEKQNAGLPEQVEPIPNFPDECGDSLWGPVLAQEEANLLHLKKADDGKNANNKDTAANSSAN
ncbi:hypothetical protein LZZ85_12870 [Terrimonas sp. NA20]|uniref:Uncharacterized protein n=1 Tax=Terrimonas ginsenosidimutans TaxID=2908004 RepID=A0ABS9KS86_9BACT|nr:hypothetical protein [Terrimonas ginsenosidimutans]MCG2615185.1 hypothetical protein [Terrimonas ginsenosidimutans]